MKHKIISKLEDNHPYETVKIKLIPSNEDENKTLGTNMTEQVENYLTFNLNAVKIIKQKPPVFMIEKMKDNVGLGG